jgi:uncharacterized protein GlcG (DUF336 family)
MVNLAAARSIIEASLKLARERNFQPLAIVVLDGGGHLVALEREDGASINRPEVAIGKASGALGMGLGSREIARRASANPAFVSALMSIFPHGVVPVPGGVLIRPPGGEGLAIGAVGISGDTSDNDEACAVHGIETAGLVAETG